MLKVLGKYINNSGLDQAFEEPEIYGPATIEQIKIGKHMKRSFEANTTLYVAPFCVYMESFVSFHPLIEKKLRKGLANAVIMIENLKRKVADVIGQNHHYLMTFLDETNFFEEKLKFDESMENQSFNFISFMKMFENLLLLLFVRSTRQCLWEEHLASLNEFMKYFFALDLQNYAQYSPVLEFFLDKNLSVSKSLGWFCSIGLGHALEQQNKSTKSGIKDIGSNESALEEHSLISCEVSQITEAFLESLNLNLDKINRKGHYQLAVETNKRIMGNVGKLKEVMKAYDVTFDKTDSVFNIFSKHVLPEKAVEELLAIKNIGENMYK